MRDILCGKLIMKTPDGKEIHLENAVINEISVEPNVLERYAPEEKDFCRKTIENYNYGLSVTIQGITRKRFIKLLMAKGIARNGAKDIARYVHEKYGYYNQIHLLLI